MKIPVCHTIQEIEAFLTEQKDSKFCLYLADKTEDEWEKSTSRVYMNQINKHLVYLPVNIKKDDYQLIEDIYRLSEKTSPIVAINQTQPHKSNPVLKQWAKGKNIPKNVDALVKDQNGCLQFFDLNGASFADWFEAEVGDFENKQVVILGVGGVGEPIARKIVERHPKNLQLVDVVSKKNLADELSATYEAKLESVSLYSQNIIFINCAGKEGASEAGITDFLQKHKDKENIFIDLRPHLNIEIVEIAKNMGWRSYTGFGMNARNDYTLLSKICELIHIKPPAFEDFQKLVALAS